MKNLHTASNKSWRIVKAKRWHTASLGMLFFGLFIFAGCTKEGPAGPTGPQGPAGPVSPAGNARIVVKNITASAWFLNEPSWIMNLEVPEVTEDIINNGMVQVYVKIGDVHHQLPSTFYVSNAYSITLGVSSRVSGIRVSWTRSDWGWEVHPGNQTFKVVILTPEARKQSRVVDWSKYEEVKAELGLED